MSTILPRRALPLAATASLALVLAGCGAAGTGVGGRDGTEADAGASASADGVVAAPAEEGALPTTVSHAFGETTIEEAPTRVVTLGWSTHDIAAALGTVPVGQDETWGGEEGLSPWFREEVEELDAPLPQVLAYSDSGELDFEQVLALDPDVILAPHSGITETDYQRLSEIAPTVAYAERPWSSESWQALVEVTGQALGQPERAREVVAETERAVADAAAEHPEFAGTTFVYGAALTDGATEAQFYPPGDPRVALVEDLGFTSTPSMDVVQAGVSGDAYTGTVSLERIEDIEADVVVGWANSAQELDATLSHPTFSRWEPIAAGHYTFLTDPALTMATSSPTPLSVPWALPQYTEDLAAAVAGDGGE